MPALIFLPRALHIPRAFPFIGKAIGIKGAFFSGPEEEASHWV